MEGFLTVALKVGYTLDGQATLYQLDLYWLTIVAINIKIHQH